MDRRSASHTLHCVVGERVEPGRVTLVIAGLTEPEGLDHNRRVPDTSDRARLGAVLDHRVRRRRHSD
jgi:hypothetical protein